MDVGIDIQISRYREIDLDFDIVTDLGTVTGYGNRYRNRY